MLKNLAQTPHEGTQSVLSVSPNYAPKKKNPELDALEFKFKNTETISKKPNHNSWISLIEQYCLNYFVSDSSGKEKILENFTSIELELGEYREILQSEKKTPKDLPVRLQDFYSIILTECMELSSPSIENKSKTLAFLLELCAIPRLEIDPEEKYAYLVSLYENPEYFGFYDISPL